MIEAAIWMARWRPGWSKMTGTQVHCRSLHGRSARRPWKGCAQGHEASEYWRARTWYVPSDGFQRSAAERILFKVAVLTYRAVNGSAPEYLSSYFTLVANVPSRLRLRSSNSDQLMVPSYNLTTVGRRAFPVFTANLWNSLPANLTSAPSLTILRQRLKTDLFRRSYSYPDLIIWHSDL